MYLKSEIENQSDISSAGTHSQIPTAKADLYRCKELESHLSIPHEWQGPSTQAIPCASLAAH